MIPWAGGVIISHSVISRQHFPPPQDANSLVTLPGHDAAHVLLNVVRSKGPGRVRDAVLIDNLETNRDSELALACSRQDDKYFHVGDFELGKSVTVMTVLRKKTFTYFYINALYIWRRTID